MIQSSVSLPNSVSVYSKTCVKRLLLKRPQAGFETQLSLNAGYMYCRMLQMEHSAILSTIIKLPFVIKIFALSSFDWPFYTGFTGTISINMLLGHCLATSTNDTYLCQLYKRPGPRITMPP